MLLSTLENKPIINNFVLFSSTFQQIFRISSGTFTQCKYCVKLVSLLVTQGKPQTKRDLFCSRADVSF